MMSNAFRLSVATLCLLFFSVGANAAILINSPTSNISTISNGDSPVSFGSDGADLLGSGEAFAFDVGPSGLSASSIVLNLDLDSPGVTGIFGFTVNLFARVAAGGDNVDPSGSPLMTEVVNLAGLTQLAFSFGPLAQGEYALFFASNDQTGSYNGRISPVPLPPAIWLFLASLVALAGVVRRQKRSVTSRSESSTALKAA